MRKLYDAAASYRIQKEFSLEIPELRDSEMRRFNIPDRETLIIQNLDMLTKKLDEGTLKPELKEALVKSFGIENSDEALRDALVENKNSVEYALSEIMNTLYYNCLSVSKPNKLNTELKALREAIVDYNDKDVLDGLAKNLQVKNDKRKVLEILDKYIEKLSSEDCSEQEFIEIYNSVGKKNQMQDFKETYERLGNILFNGQEANPNIIAGFNLINELPQDAPIEQTLAVYQQIGDYFNQISLMTSSFQQALEIHNENGEILNTVSPKEIILKILEKKNEIVPVKNLKVFQDRIARVEKAKISSDGGSILLKDLPKELTTLTKPEKETLDIIEKNINKWYAQTTRSLEKQYRLMKPTLGELHRNLGIKKGLYWVHTDGVSGLNSRQQVRIFEYMTDRPYYTEENIRAAVKKIKKSPYSGISSTSVNDKEMAMHAQYIVDIAPVEVTTSNGKETKEALFHDNTWGPAEQDNTWKDETGLLRTDYDDKLGGKRGYITNDKYRNGLLLENIYNSTGSYTEDYIDSKRYKKLTKVKTPTTFDFPMFSDVIVPGRDPKASSNLRSIREHLFISPTKFFSQLEEDAQEMTKAEIQSLISKTADDGTAVVNKYTEIVNRVKGDDILNSGINTKEDYDKLSDTDELKILFEKIALTKSYNQIANDKIFYRKTSLAELSDIRKEIAIEARKNFDYVFGKNIDIAKYGFESIQDEVYDLLDDFQKTTHVKITPANMEKIASSLEKIRSKYGADSLSEDVDDLLEDLKKTVPVKITPSKKFKIANSLGKINKDGFDGSLDKTIDLMTNNFMQTLAANTVGFENKDAKIKELGNKINAMLHGKMDFNIKDLNAMSNGDDFSQNIVKWIDDMYDPVTDEEFVKIFRRIQNMSKEEFNNTFGAKITDELTGIKNISGYDILKKFKMADEKTQDLVFSTLYNEEMGYQIRMSKIVPQYGYGKLEKTLQGYVYKDDKRSFDEIYLDYYYSLLTINLHKKYDKLKDEAFLKYQLFPAIPQLDVEDPEESLNMFRRLYTGISDSVEQINNIKECEKAYNTLDKLTAYLNKFDDDKILTPAQQRYVNSKITEFLKVADKDDTIKQSIEVANTILQLSNGIDAQTYRELLGVINDELNQYRPAAGKTFEDNIQAQIKDINDKKRSFIMNVIDPKYEKDAYELLNKWISAKIKNSEDEEFLFEDFENFYKKHGILKSPEKMLNEYLLLLAKPSPEDKKIVQKSDEQIKQLENVKEVYKSNLTSMLILSNLLSLQYVLMRCAKEGNLNIVRDEFKKSKIELNNGTVIPLDSEQGLHTVMSEILVDKDLDTAIMFLEQLGLCEEYIDLVNSNDKFFDKAYKSAKRIFNIYGALDRQTKIINEEIEKLGDLNNDPNYLGKIDMLQERILDRCKNTHYRKSLSLIEPAITDIKNSLQNNPAYNKVEFIKSYVQSIRDGSLMIAEKDLETPKSVLEQYQTVYDLVEKIKLPLNSPYEEKRKEFIEKYEKLNEFVSSKRKSYTNINISTL
jgi:hypothetical protein